MPESMTVETLANRLDLHLTECVKVRKETLDSLKDNRDAVKDLVNTTGALAAELSLIKHFPISVIKWLLPVVLAAAISGIVSNFMAHQAAMTAAQQAQTTASTVVTTSASTRLILHKLEELERAGPGAPRH